MVSHYKLSICIATFNRSRFIGETLDAILHNLPSDVEIIVVDGGSSDQTEEVMTEYANSYNQIRYIREVTNSGVDADFDKAVCYAKGQFCWLMSDDDILKPGAIQRVLNELIDNRDLVIVNAEIRNHDLTELFVTRQLQISSDRQFNVDTANEFFSSCANYLSFIGCVVVRTSVWKSRNRKEYYGTLFVHVGVIFQNPPVANVFVISDPLIIIRYGNAMWSPRSFEIWMFKWPSLIWGFSCFDSEHKSIVCRQFPWQKFSRLVYYRAVGVYSYAIYKKYFTSEFSVFDKLKLLTAALLPKSLLGSLFFFYTVITGDANRMMQYDVVRANPFLKCICSKT